MPEDDRWAFLDAWFASLRGRVSIDSPHRADTEDALTFGRDPETDWWLRVDWHLGLSSGSAADRLTKLQKWREAVLLAGTLASVDNRAWIQKLCGISRFVVPPFMDLATHPLRANFIVAFSELHSPEWDVLASWLETDFSDDFKRDYERVMAARVRRGGHEHVTPRLRLVLVCHQQPFLAAVEAMLATYVADADREERVGFVLDSVDLNAMVMVNHSDVLDALRRVIETREKNRQIAAAPHGVHFAKALCGHGQNASSGQLVGGVRKITVPLWDATHPDFGLLCSALLHARGVKHVCLAMDAVLDEGHVPEPFPESVWALIALALLSRDSTTSVEALTVRGVPITEEDTATLLDMVNGVYPLHHYASMWVPNTEPSRPANRVPSKVCIPAGTDLTGYYGFDDDEYSITTAEDTEAFVVFEEAGVAHVLIIGRGFCEVSSRALPSKRSRSTRLRRVTGQDTSSLLKSLELVTERQDTTSQAQLKEFVEFVGGKTLQRLRLEIPNLTEEHLADVLSVCPNLAYLAVSGLAMDSMKAMENAHAAGVPLQSLELLGSQIGDKGLCDYLRSTMDIQDSADDDVGPLVGLRIGQVGDIVLDHVDALLETSDLLYLDYRVAKPVQSSYARLAAQHHGRPTGDVREPLDVASQMAFLGCLRVQASSNPLIALTDEQKASIIAYASTPFTRTVLCREGTSE